MVRRVVLGIAAAVGLVVAAPAVADADSAAAGGQVEIWWMDASVHRVEQVRVGDDGLVSHRYRSSAGFWSGWYDLGAEAARDSGVTIDGQGGLVYVYAVTGTVQVTGAAGAPLCADGPDWGAWYAC